MGFETDLRAECEQCPMLDPKLTQQTLYADGEIAVRILTVTCSRKAMCDRIMARLTEELKKVSGKANDEPPSEG